MSSSLSRREFLTVAATAPLALQSLGLVNAAETQTRLPLITLFLSGGASAKETFNPDPPETPVELRGPLDTIATRTTGIYFSELFPKLASRSDQFSLLRALDSGSPNHEDSQQTAVLSGSRTISEVIGERAASVPYVLLNPGSNWPGLRSAFRITSSYGPLWDAAQRKFVTPAGGAQQDIQEPQYKGYMPVERPPTPPAGPPPGLVERRALLKAIETKPMHSNSPAVERMQRLYETAFELTLGGGRFFEALDLPERDRERYGKTLAGDMTLLAKRFVERGAGAVTIYHDPTYLAWDAHNNLAQRYRDIAPDLDHAAATLIDEITRNRFQCVLLLMGEFNRHPHITNAGREHWQYGNCAILAGGSARAGVVHGRTNSQGQIISEGVQQREVLGNTVMAATGIELEATKPRVREILT